jgi:hypothetical protein
LKTLLVSGVLLALSAGLASTEAERLIVRVSWGHAGNAAADRRIGVSGSNGLEITSISPHLFEAEDKLHDAVARTRSGRGDVDGLELRLSYPERQLSRAQRIHVQWFDLIAASDGATARRLSRDPAFTPGAPALTIQLDEPGTSGFTVTVDQLLAESAIWIPSLDVFVAAGNAEVPFADHMRRLAAHRGGRVLDRVRIEAEASYAEYTARWADMGSPSYINPYQQGPGHIVGLTWDSAIRKFGIDRAAGVWNDEGNPDKFRFWFAFGDLASGVSGRWKGQRLHDGLPIVTTTFEDDGIRYEVEQFAYPLNGPPVERRGDMSMVLLQQVTITELQGKARSLPVSMAHRRLLPPYIDSTVDAERQGDAVLFRGRGGRQVLLTLEGADREFALSGTSDFQKQQKRFDVATIVDLAANGSRRFVVKLPSPVTSDEETATLTAIQYETARETTKKFWSEYLARGAQIRVPEQVVNDLFRASLWHALRLPRRHGGSGPGVAIDLPYSNFAYGQTGTPWPVNQAVYVDYMLYDLRGYHAISAEELDVQFRNNQETDGHVNGYANWLVYTPSMLYSVSQNYLLSNDQSAFERLLPQSMKAMDWCLRRLAAASEGASLARGLVRGPLNDGTGEGIWAFNQAYLFAGLDLFGRGLDRYGHPRAADARRAASAIRDAVARGFGAASMRSPLVQLRDSTWVPYVPAEALTRGRLLTEWYPTDVDTGATHLLRLKALPERGTLADALLNDHEDNLYFKGWGMAQEPIYNQQATAYLLRDEPEAAIRAFYSYFASAFSHSVLEPVEHRWGQGQYFGPPSTDGAWFELYRNMLVRERDDDVLIIGQAVPRAWLRDGERIAIERLPTYFGELSATLESRAKSGEMRAEVRFAGERRPAALHVRFRHPERLRMKSVTVNNRPWKDFDAEGEWVRIRELADERQAIVVRY